MTKVYVVDDDMLFGTELESMISSLEGFEFVGRSETFSEAVHSIRRIKPDILICDIRLDRDFTGIDLATEIKSLEIPIIFATAYSDFSVYNNSKAFAHSKFIVKPFDKLTLAGMLDEIVDEQIKLSVNDSIRNDMLYVRKNKVFEKVMLEDIDYLYSEGNYITLFHEKKKFILKYSLSKLLEVPKFDRFVRIHRSYAVHHTKVSSVDLTNKQVTIKETRLPFGRTYVKNVKGLMRLYLK